ncbi:MAG: TolC family protein, partial [Bacteroidia bacterium]|nr:TolC family protein [Bacteroidia bacterium]
MIDKRVHYILGSKIRFCFYLAVFLLIGCSPKYKALSIKEKVLPKSYNTFSDSLNIAEINWKKYFSDPTLELLIDSALVNNLDLQMALQKIEISRAGVKLAKGALLPQVGLNIGGGVRKFGLYTMDGAGNISTQITPGQIVPIDLPDMNIGLQASWELDIWGKLRNQRKSAVSNYLATIE